MSVSPRRRGMRSTRGLQGAGLLVTSAPAGKPLQCRLESAESEVAPAHGRLPLHNLPEKQMCFQGLNRSRQKFTQKQQVHRY